ncbi:GNAT family N-acetyltransferase [Microvirga sp. CF3062]|uniref:GNAT family N-acetyltransferase n=1 Tax=Microvirga sp. CF3062 TaxID=3110182 RepID=UPI002E798F49|nr:GNAT family N-acetyltransferase [Microvirga sp. CF3062]MEE1656944.1 GNAT family N-acetyltransferase [Microvirga sp. CF3062]
MFKNSFDPQPEMMDDTLSIRPLMREDIEELFSAASNPEIWAGHPAEDRYKREKFEPYFVSLLESRAALAVIDRRLSQIIGCSRYYVSPDQHDSVSIGFTFLNHAYWGGETNFHLKRLMLEHAFKSFPEVWFHIAPTNIRSQKATAKLGAEHAYNATLDLSGSPAVWMCFRLSKDAWNRVLTSKNA